MNSTNETFNSCTFTLAYKITVSSLLGTTLLFSPILNFIVCYTIFSSSHLYTFGNILISNLSIGDIMISLSLPLLEIMYISLHPRWLIGKLGTYALNAIWLFSLAAPFVTVTAMTVERFLTLRSLKSLVRVTSKSCISFTIVFIWVYNIGVVSLMVYYFTVPGEEAYEWDVLPEFYYPFLAFHIVAPLIAIAALYLCIFRLINRSAARSSRQNMSSALSAKREMRVVKTVGILVGVMFAIWIPALVLEYFYYRGTESCLVQMAGPISVWLSCSNGVVNPVIYFYRNPIMRGEIARRMPRLSKVLRLKEHVVMACVPIVPRAAGVNDGYQRSAEDIASDNTLSTDNDTKNTADNNVFDTRL